MGILGIVIGTVALAMALLTVRETVRRPQRKLWRVRLLQIGTVILGADRKSVV